MDATDSNMEDVSVSDTTKEEDVPKKKRRVLKRVLKKDKAKEIKPKYVKRKMNTSLSSLSKSLNRSVTSLVIKQTLQSNNRQLAMTLEKTRQELRMANTIIMDQKGEIVDLQAQISTYKHLAGLKPEEIENEVKYRMEKYVTELKMHHGNIGQKLFDATKSLGDAMDLCINISRRSTCGSARSSTLSIMSDDEGGSYQAVRPAMFQSHIIQSDLPRSLPQRVACHDMSVIAEQSILLDDILPPEDMVMHSTEGLQVDFIEEENIACQKSMEFSSKGGKPPGSECLSENKESSDSQSKGDNFTENVESRDRQSKGDKFTQNVENQTCEKAKEIIQEEIPNKKNRRETFVLPQSKEKTQNMDKQQNKKMDEEKTSKIETVPNKGNNKRSKNRGDTYELLENTSQSREIGECQKEKRSRSKHRGDTYELPESTSQSKEIGECQKEKRSRSKHRGDTFELPESTSQSREIGECQKEKRSRSKHRGDTFELPESTSQSREIGECQKEKRSRSKHRGDTLELPESTSQSKEIGECQKEKRSRSKHRGDTLELPESTSQSREIGECQKEKRSRSKHRGDTFELPESTSHNREIGECQKEKKSKQETFVIPDLKSGDMKDRRGTFVLPKNVSDVVSKNETLNSVNSKSDGFLSSDDERRKTFLVTKEQLLPPPPSNLQKIAPQCSFDPEVTEYFNCDMEFTAVIDNSNRIILESSNNVAKEQTSVSDIDQSKSAKVSNKIGKVANNDKRLHKTTDAGKKPVTADNKTGFVTSDKPSTKTENQPAVEFRLPKPGKIVFAASRKTFDGKRERVPSKLPQKSRSKTKVKLTKSTKNDDGDVKSMFDFHEKTPTVLKQTSSIYDLSLNESVQGQKESYGSYRNKIHNAAEEDKRNTDNSRKLVQPNDKGEIVYHLPLKGCSPDIPETSRSQSKRSSGESRERSRSRGRSRGKRIVNENTDKNVEEDNCKTQSSDTRSRSRGRSRQNVEISNEVNDDNQSSVKRGRSRSRKRLETGEEIIEDMSHDGRRSNKRVETKEEMVKNASRGRSRSKKRTETRDEIVEDESRGRSRSKKRTEIGDEIVEDASHGRSRSKKRTETGEEIVAEVSRGRSKSKKRTESGEEIVNDESLGISKSKKRTETGDEMVEKASPRRSRSKRRTKTRDEMIDDESRGRSRSKKKDDTVSDSENHVDAGIKRSKSRGRSRTRKNKTNPLEEEVIDKHVEPDLTSQRRVTRSKSRGRLRSSEVKRLLGSWDSDDDSQDKNDQVIEDTNVTQTNDNVEVTRSKSIISKAIEDEAVFVELKTMNEDEKTVNDSPIQMKENMSETIGSRSRSARSKSRSRAKISYIELSEDEDFQSTKKCNKKLKKHKSSEDNKLNALDKLFKNAKKKSLPDRVVSPNRNSEINDIQNVLIEQVNTNDESFHVICETLLKPRDFAINENCQNSETNSNVTDHSLSGGDNQIEHTETKGHNSDTDSQLAIGSIEIDNFEMDLKCVTERGRGRSSKPNKNNFDDLKNKCRPVIESTLRDGDHEENRQSAFSGLRTDDNGSAEIEAKGKRQNDSPPDPTGDRKKIKITKKVDKENRCSSLNDLRNKLALLRKTVQPENTPVTDVTNTVMEKDHVRTSQGNGLLTPTLERVTEEPRSRRKAVGVCYREQSLNKKLRREDVLSENTQN